MPDCFLRGLVSGGRKGNRESQRGESVEERESQININDNDNDNANGKNGNLESRPARYSYSVYFPYNSLWLFTFSVFKVLRY